MTKFSFANKPSSLEDVCRFIDDMIVAESGALSTDKQLSRKYFFGILALFQKEKEVSRYAMKVSSGLPASRTEANELGLASQFRCQSYVIAKMIDCGLLVLSQKNKGIYTINTSLWESYLQYKQNLLEELNSVNFSDAQSFNKVQRDGIVSVNMPVALMDKLEAKYNTIRAVSEKVLRALEEAKKAGKLQTTWFRQDAANYTEGKACKRSNILVSSEWMQMLEAIGRKQVQGTERVAPAPHVQILEILVNVLN